MDDKSATIPTGKRYMNIMQVGDYLSVSKYTIYRWVSQRDIPFIHVGKVLRFDPKAIDEWMQKKSVKTKAEV